MPTLNNTEGGEKNFEAVNRAPWAKGFGLLRNIAGIFRGRDNDYDERWTNAAGSDYVEALRVDTENAIRVAGSKVTQKAQPIIFREPTADAVATKRFFVNPLPFDIEVVAIQMSWATAESTATTCTAQVTKDADATAAGAGVNLLSSAINVKGTKDTVNEGTLATNRATLKVSQGESLSFVLSAASTELAGLAVTVWVTPAGGYKFATIVITPNADIADCIFYVANRPTRIKYAALSFSTAGSADTDLQIQKNASTEAAGSGTDLLSAALDLTATADTVQQAAILTTAATIRLAAGDRLGLDFPADVTALVGVCVTVALSAEDDLIDATFTQIVNADHVDAILLHLNRQMELIDARAVWGTAASSGNANINHQTGTQTPEQGTALLTNDTNAGFQIDGTAATPEVGAFGAAGGLSLLDGDRVGIDFTAITSLVNFCSTLTFRQR